jgi:putative phosphoesterase
MRIGIVSDTHSRHATVVRVVELLRAEKVDLVLHCGDIEDGQTVELLGGLPTHFVLGNCDADVKELRRAMQKTGAILHEPFGDLELAGRKIAWLHGDDKRLLQDLEQCGHFDYLFYGHTHQAEQHRAGGTLVVNPGALHRAQPKTFTVLDLDRDELQSIELPGL